MEITTSVKNCMDKLSQFPYSVLITTAPWCGHCKTLKSALTELSLKDSDLPIVLFEPKDNDEEASEMKKKIGVRGFPHVISVFGGKVFVQQDQFMQEGQIFNSLCNQALKRFQGIDQAFKALSVSQYQLITEKGNIKDFDRITQQIIVPLLNILLLCFVIRELKGNIKSSFYDLFANSIPQIKSNLNSQKLKKRLPQFYLDIISYLEQQIFDKQDSYNDFLDTYFQTAIFQLQQFQLQKEEEAEFIQTLRNYKQKNAEKGINLVEEALSMINQSQENFSAAKIIPKNEIKDSFQKLEDQLFNQIRKQSPDELIQVSRDEFKKDVQISQQIRNGFFKKNINFALNLKV